jgi:hypothetical protein
LISIKFVGKMTHISQPRRFLGDKHAAFNRLNAAQGPQATFPLYHQSQAMI